MIGTTSHYRPASAADGDHVLLLQRDFYAEEGHPFAAQQMRTALETLLGDPSLGQVWLAEDAQRLVAYAVLTLGYSLEHHRRDAFVAGTRHLRRSPSTEVTRHAIEYAESIGTHRGSSLQLDRSV